MFARPQNEQATGSEPSRWAKLPISLRAIVSGLFLAIVSLNVWPVLLVILPVPLAAFVEAAFLLFFLWWAGGGGPPDSTKSDRAASFRSGELSVMRWGWGLCAALFFAVTVHASIVLLFRFVAFPVATFRNGYDLSFIHSQFLKWTVVLISAVSAGICEEVGFRGYMQQPIEQRNGVLPSKASSSMESGPPARFPPARSETISPSPSLTRFGPRLTSKPSSRASEATLAWANKLFS